MSLEWVDYLCTRCKRIEPMELPPDDTPAELQALCDRELENGGRRVKKVRVWYECPMRGALDVSG